MDERKTYTERQAAEFVRRASELQMRTAETAPRGIGAEDLRRMAADLGIEPRFMDQALAEGSSSRAGPFQFVSHRERLVDGEPDFDLLAEMSAHSGFRSHARQIGNTFIAHVIRRGGRHTVTLRKQGTQTRVVVESAAVFPILVGGLGTFYAFLFSMAALDSYDAITALWIPLAVLMACGVVASLLVRPWIARSHRGGQEVLEQYSGTVKQVDRASLSAATPVIVPEPQEQHAEQEAGSGDSS